MRPSDSFTHDQWSREFKLWAASPDGLDVEDILYEAAADEKGDVPTPPKEWSWYTPPTEGWKPSAE